MLLGCADNDRSSQRELYELLAEYAMGICYRYARNHQEAEELVNEGFVKLFRNLHRFDVDRHSDMFNALRGWFKRILINTCIDQYRKNQHDAVSLAVPDDHDQIPDTQATAADMLSYKEIVEAVRQLSPSYRSVFNLFAIEGMTHEEISRQLGISVGTSKSNLSKAREKLKKIIKNITRQSQYA